MSGKKQVMRPEVIDYVLAKFEAERTGAVDGLSMELQQMRRGNKSGLFSEARTTHGPFYLADSRTGSWSP
jgi:hypothetical protein